MENTNPNQGINQTMLEGRFETLWESIERLPKKATNNLVDSIEAIIKLSREHPELQGDIEYLLNQARKY
jgi:hypothetical protein